MDCQGAQGRARRKARRNREGYKRQGGPSLAVLRSPGPPVFPSGSSLGSLTIHQTTLSYSLPPLKFQLDP